MRIKEIEVYSFAELSEDAKEHVFEKHGDINVNHDWWYDYDDKKEIAKLMGIDIDNIYFSGFSSQGDGACFEGNYEYRKGSVKAVMDYAPEDIELHRIVKELQSIQKRCFYSARASVKQSGHYMHKYCTKISVDFENYNTGIDYYNQKYEEDIIELLRDYMEWIYRNLEKEYEYLTGEDAIVETIEANEYEFDVDGNMA